MKKIKIPNDNNTQEIASIIEKPKDRGPCCQKIKEEEKKNKLMGI